MATIRLSNYDVTIPASPAVSILNCILREGYGISHLCGGKAQCGTCKIEVLEGAGYLSPMTDLEKIRLKPEEGSSTRPSMRLACQTFCSGDITIRILATGGTGSTGGTSSAGENS